MVAGSVVVVLLMAALLLLLPMGKTGNQKHFNELIASGKAFLAEKKYDEAVHDRKKLANFVRKMLRSNSFSGRRDSSATPPRRPANTRRP